MLSKNHLQTVEIAVTTPLKIVLEANGSPSSTTGPRDLPMVQRRPVEEAANGSQ